ncbi:GNAT family N-acetyltransferase [Planomicrobium okeanokoites]
MTVPHWYLWALGVAPDAQRQGIGGLLLDFLPGFWWGFAFGNDSVGSR